jgi:hypothetical protein
MVRKAIINAIGNGSYSYITCNDPASGRIYAWSGHPDDVDSKMIYMRESREVCRQIIKKHFDKFELSDEDGVYYSLTQDLNVIPPFVVRFNGFIGE